MRPLERLSRVANRASSVPEVYASQSELIADLSVTLPQIDSLTGKLERSQRAIRRIMNARESINVDLAAVFAKWNNVMHEEASA